MEGIAVKNASPSLEHGVLKNKDDGYNCCVFTLLMIMMRHKGEMVHLQRHCISDKLIECRLRFFNLINDIFKAIIPNNKFFYDWEEHGVQK